MSRIFVPGAGAVSPAGWGVAALREALNRGEPLPVQTLARPGWEKTLRVRTVPPPADRPAFLAHPRLRRASVLAQHTVAAALEALDADAAKVQAGELRLGVVVCMLAGVVTYSRKFYSEVLQDPATASPLIFPETVFNAPASHLAAYLGATGINYTLVGDDGTFLQGLALAADWLADDRVDGVVVVGAEELDWIVADAVRLFRRDLVFAGGAGALYLKKNPPAGVELAAVTDSFLFSQTQNRAAAVAKMRQQLGAGAADELLCNSAAENPRATNWPGPRLALRVLLGEAFTAAAAWECVAAVDALRRGKFPAASVAVAGINQQAIGARFRACARAA
jgi:3-oxoacyl-(acyl-carrier-protein) synthase